MRDSRERSTRVFFSRKASISFSKWKRLIEIDQDRNAIDLDQRDRVAAARESLSRDFIAMSSIERWTSVLFNRLESDYTDAWTRSVPRGHPVSYACPFSADTMGTIV